MLQSHLPFLYKWYQSCTSWLTKHKSLFTINFRNLLRFTHTTESTKLVNPQWPTIGHQSFNEAKLFSFNSKVSSQVHVIQICMWGCIEVQGCRWTNGQDIHNLKQFYRASCLQARLYTDSVCCWHSGLRYEAFKMNRRHQCR